MRIARHGRRKYHAGPYQLDHMVLLLKLLTAALAASNTFYRNVCITAMQTCGH